MPTTLLTGANGFVGAAVLDDLLRENHTVIATTRSSSSATTLLSVHPSWPKSQLIWETVPDFTADGAFDYIFQSHPEIEHIMHVAAPVLDDPKNTDFVEHFEKPSVLGNLGLLKSAKAYGKNVKSVAVVGSMNAITTGAPEDVAARTFDSTQWLPLGREEAIQMQNPYISYCVGKKLAEKAIWEFVETERPAFTVTNFNPPIIIGPVEQHIKDMGHMNWSTDQFYSFFNGKNETVPATTFPGYIDVRDLSALLILSLTTAAAQNKRFVVGHEMSYRTLSNALRHAGAEDEVTKEVKGRLAKENQEDNPTMPRLDTTEIAAAFPSFEYRSMETTVVDAAKRIVEVEKRLKA